MALLAAVGCVGSKSVPCGPLVCALNDVCAPSGDRCVQPQQLESCNGVADGAACSYPGVAAGACFGGICAPVGCGNNVVEPDLGEICDDGNRVSLDGCSADCASRETCGDGVVDLFRGEQCDCGSPGKAAPGCSQENSNAPGATCRLNCKPGRCGDGVLDPQEICDDGNVDPGDGCRADCMGRWTVMQSNTYADLTAVWGSGPTDVYAVGYEIALHYDGAHWTKLPLPRQGMQLSDVWGSGSDVYAIGPVPETSGFAGRLFKLTPTSCSEDTSFPANTLNGVWHIHGVSSTDIFAVNTNSSLWHLTAGVWSATGPCPRQGGGNVVEFSSVYADGAGHAYAASNSGDVCRFSGGSWTEILEYTSGGTTPSGASVWGTGASDLYLLSGHFNDLDTVSHSTDGTTWSDIPAAKTAIVYANGLGGTPGDLILVGDSGRIATFNGTSWGIERPPVSTVLRDAWGYAPGRAFVVGSNGVILY